MKSENGQSFKEILNGVRKKPVGRNKNEIDRPTQQEPVDFGLTREQNEAIGNFDEETEKKETK